MMLVSVPKGSDTAFPNQQGPAPVDTRHLRHFSHLFKAFGNAVQYIIVASPDQQPLIDPLLSAAGVSNATYILSPHFRKSIWIQDAHVALHDGSGHPILCEGVAFNRFEDMSVADDVAMQTDVRAVQSRLYFQGGNVLGAKDVTLVGRDYLWRNTERFGLKTENDVIAAFQREFGTEILGLGGPFDPKLKDLFSRGILSGYGLQPIFHIDMFVTRTGVRNGEGREIVFLGRPAAAEAIVGSYSDMPELDTPLYDSCFDQTAADLATRFEVRTLPLWITFGSLRDSNNRQKFYNLTWNNAIVENARSVRRVLLPNYTDGADCRAYGVDRATREQLQAAVEEAWRSLEFEVRFMDGMEDLAWGDGALHCMTKVLRRRC
jgi:hypothetical protein